MGPWCHMAQQHKCNCSHLTASAAQIPGTTLLGKRNLPLDTSKLHFSTVRLKVLKHKPPAQTQKLCVIKQLHSTQRVSMTTKKTPWQAPKGAAIVTMLLPRGEQCSTSKLTTGTKQKTRNEQAHIQRLGSRRLGIPRNEQAHIQRNHQNEQAQTGG